MIERRLDGILLARASAVSAGQSSGELAAAVRRFAPLDATDRAWRERVDARVATLAEAGLLGPRCTLSAAGAGELARILAPGLPTRWLVLADRVLPEIALGVAPSDRAHLSGRDAWAAAIEARASGIWRSGPPPRASSLGDALAWQGLGLSGPARRCPPAIRAVFAQRALATIGAAAGNPAPTSPLATERALRTLAAARVGAARADARGLRDGLVRGWLAGQALGPERAFTDDVLAAARALGDGPGTFGARKAFVAAVWEVLRRAPRWAALDLGEFKSRLVAEHRAGRLELTRADLVAAMDPALVAASETPAGNATFHFIVRGT